MLRITLLSICVLAGIVGIVTATNEIPRLDGRIVGGQQVPISEHPYQVSMRYKSCDICAFQHFCGGSIVNDGKAIVFAAHCADGRDAKYWMAVAGTDNRGGSDGIPVLVDNITIHEDFNAGTFDHDIAVAFLATPLPLNGYSIRAIDLATMSPEPRTLATVSGWGTTSEGGVKSEKLQDVTVRIVSQEDCANAYGEDAITDNMLCAGTPEGGRDACQGDSGGPLVVENQLVGVVSWGKGCARPNYPGVYADIASHFDWLQYVIYGITTPTPTTPTTQTIPTVTTSTPTPTDSTSTPTDITPTPTDTTPTSTGSTPTPTDSTPTPTGSTPTPTGTTPTSTPTWTPPSDDSEFAFY